MSVLLAHEVAHTLGLEEAYNTEGHDHQTSWECIMEKYKEEHLENIYSDIKNGLAPAFCEDCIAGLTYALS